MLRPSRPMIRPFMSSEGSSTSVTVVSAVALAATRCSASATRLRARRFASDAASSSIWRTRAGELVAHLGLGLLEDLPVRLAGRQLGDALELAPLAVAELLQLFLELLEVDLAVGDALVAPGELGELLVDLIFFREDALLDLDDLVAPFAELRLELASQLDGELAGFDLALAAGRFGLAAGVVEQQLAGALGRVEP